MVITKEENTQKLADIWLRVSLLAHDFVTAEHWRAHRGVMCDTYLPSAANYSIRENPDGEILGFLSLTGDREAERVEALFIDLPYMGQGLGRKLLDFAKERYERLTLNVYSRNGKAVRFYCRNGFEAVSNRRDAATGEEELVMEWRKEP